MTKKRMNDIRAPRTESTAKKTPARTREDYVPETPKAEPQKEQTQPSFSSQKREKAPWRGITPRDKTHSFARNAPPRNPHKIGGPSRRKWVWIGSVALLIFVFFLVSSVFDGATITVTPREEQSVIDGTFNAIQNADTANTDSVSYQVMALSDSVSTQVPASEEREVQQKASGQIVVYNKHSSASQRLVRNTRFETPDGKIYRIDESIVIPGTTVENGEIVPGSLEVTVYADEPGEEYNIGLTDFTVPGFKGDPRFETFYARSKTDMTGGFSGVKRSPTQEDLERAESELQSQLTDKLNESAQGQKPEGFTLYEDARRVAFNEPKISVEKETATVSVRGTLQALILNTDTLERFIAEQSLASYDGADVRIPNIETLDFALVSEDIQTENGQAQFTLSGGVSVVWEVDGQRLQQTLAGAPKGQFQQTLAEFPNIKRAEASIRPFWKRTFPENVSDITIRERADE